MKSLKAILAGLVALAAIHAKAEYLLWALDWDEVDENATYAAVVVLDSEGKSLTPETYARWVDTDNPSMTGTMFKRDPEGGESEVTSVIDSPYNNPSAGYKFAITLYDSSKNAIAASDPATFSELSDSIWGGNMSPGVSTSWNPTKYNAVPEPATGTLFILGSLMLFRRKRA